MSSEFWRKFRVVFRWCRISILLLILAATCLLLWFNLVGLPSAFKKPLLADLQRRGVHLSFSRIRLRMARGIVVDDVRAAAVDNSEGPAISFREVQLLLDIPALLHGHLHIEGLVLHEGRLVVPVNGSAPLEATNIQTELRFPGNDTWSLDNFAADFKGAKLYVTGDIAHAQDFRNWEIFRRQQTPSQPGTWPQRLQNFSQALDKMNLQGTPWLTLNFEGDARHPQSFAVSLQITAPGAQTPWFGARDLKFKANLRIPSANPTNPPLLGVWSDLQPYRVSWSTHFTQMRATSVTAAAVDASGFWRAPDMALDVRLHTAAETTHYPVSVQDLELNAYLTAPGPSATNLVLSGIGSNLQPWQVSWSTRVNHVHSEKFNAESIAASGYWWSPKLAVDQLAVQFGRGHLRASLRFDAASHLLDFTNSSAFDLRVLDPFLPADVRARLAEITWSAPPNLRLAGRVDVSPWLTNSPGQELPLPRLSVNGELAFTDATIAGLHLDAVQTLLAYSNLIWQVQDFHVRSAATDLQIQGSLDENTELFQARLQGAFDVNQIRPWLKSKTAAREVGRLTFHEPLILDVTARGNLDDIDAFSAAGKLALTNFAARGGSMDSLVTGITYSNRVIEFLHPVGWREHGSQTITADAITLDLNALRISFTNGFSTATPQVIVDSIGPKTGLLMEPYQFLTPPTARVNGFVSLNSSEDNDQMETEDLQVEILKGAPFRWQRFNTKSIEGSARWFGPTLLLTNLTAEFYDGQARGTALFDFRPVNGTDYQFDFNITNANLHWLVAGLSGSTNKLEGLVGGHIVCTSGNSTNWQGMNGYGNATLTDGLLWDAPIFGRLSPALNAIIPGMGSSRATDAAGQFIMKNGILHSDSVEIHTTMMRLHYDGTVDLSENLNARATAQILRDTPGLGVILNVIAWPVTKLFEYKVTGTLADPKIAPANDIAKLILAPLHPIKTLEHILPVGNTNAAPSVDPVPRH